ncbi:ArnT family glycosyltransferase [Negadavirga shengliensis]|uniref:ArnT family glycosyltransferase n=1 Tax=Negadavirga shengliensis TaxID=1389218 RepID=A0ABV9T7K4_9BACT
MKDNMNRKYRIYLALILILVAFLKLLFTALTPLSLFSEETQYWLWSRHLDWNYYSKPLMIALYNRASTFLLGNTELGVRVNAVLFTSLTAWMVFELSLYMYKKPAAALLAAVMLLVMPFFHLASLFHTTDSSLVFFWVLAMYFVWRAINEDRMGWWIAAGVATGLGILSKNVMLLIIPLIFLYLLLMEPKTLLKKGFYVYGWIAALSFVPVLVWNFQNDFVTFRHVGTLGGVSGNNSGWEWSRAWKYVGEYVGGQLAVISVWFIPLLILSFRRMLKYKGRRTLFVLLPVVSVWIMFLGISLFKRVEVNWPAFVYATLPIVLVQAFRGKPSWKRYAHWATAISAVLLVLIMKPAPLDAIGFKKLLRPDKDPLARLAGYRELGNRIDFLLDSLKVEDHFVFSDTYHISSELAFYMEGHPQTYNPNLGRRKNQFDLWPGLEQFEYKGYAGIFVKWGEEDIPLVGEAFGKKIHDETLTAYYRGSPVRVFRIQIFEDYKKLEEMDWGTY